ncbi:MMPL family transporter [Gelidibacter maritimus]|uniref:MMPL family transporter n=1 Tax=Gelidibacter maritimus TaxID=2761487 RepID=A0A7W2M775_9FLAO|nr:MMPL family transporter [Gelidibacter maritimus]MBA6153887.1 MMPL family transporter [Gelidibacter maritimus]
MAKFFYTLYQTLKKYKPLFVIALIIIFGLLMWTASTIKFDEDISKLIPSNSENEHLQKVLKTAQFADKIIVNIEKAKDGTTDDLTEYATQLLDSLSTQSSSFIKDIQGKIEDETIFETMDFVYSNVPLFLKTEDYKTISNKLQPDSIAKITENNYKTLISPSGIVSKKTIIKDPLGISLMALKHLQQLGISDDFILKDGFLVSKNERHLLLFITPAYPSNNTTDNAMFSEQLYRFQDELNTVFEDKAQSSYFGGTLIAVANAQQIKNDIQITVSIAMVLLMTLFIVFYKKLTIPIILFVPTLFGGLLAISVLSVIRSEISAISLGIGAVLLGVTLDYSLHILTHIRNNETAKELFDGVSKPILMSGLTTALAFLCLMFVDSSALQDLGIFAAISVMGASVFALIFIPQFYKGSSTKNTKRSIVDKIASYDFHRNKILIGSIVALLILSGFNYQRATFNHDISNLNFQPETIKSAEAKLDTLINISSKSLYVIAFGNNEQQVLETNDEIFNQLQDLETENKVLSYNSVGALVGSDKKQQESIRHWKRFWTSELKAETQSELIENGSKFGFKPSTFQEFYALLNHEFHPLSIDDYRKINVIPISDFIAEDGNFMTITSVVNVRDENIDEIKNTFKDSENTLVIDRQAINETLLGHLKNDFNKLLIYCVIVVVLLLLLFYKNFKLTLVTILPIIITWFITIGIMGLFHLEFNIFNIIISSFIFGLGVDYSIFMTNGMRSGKSSMATHKTSIILSVLTTILGVGVLIFAKHPALHSLATISIIGILTAMFISFVLQPILYNLLISKKSTEK